jgi:uncharacterized protein (TIGR03067 family)
VTSTLLVGLALIAGAPAKKDAPAKEPPTLVGDWAGESGIHGGKPENPPPGTTLTFTADGKVLFKEGGDGKPEEGSYKADAKKDPAEIDITPPDGPKGEILRGIYKIEGDTLTLCFSMKGPAEGVRVPGRVGPHARHLQASEEGIAPPATGLGLQMR